MKFERGAVAAAVLATMVWADQAQAVTFGAIASVRAGGAQDHASDAISGASAMAQYQDTSDPALGIWSEFASASAGAGALSGQVTSTSPAYEGVVYGGLGGYALSGFQDVLTFDAGAVYARLTFAYEGALSVDPSQLGVTASAAFNVYGNGYLEQAMVLSQQAASTSQSFSGAGELLFEVGSGPATIGASMELAMEACRGSVAAGVTACGASLDFSKGLRFTGGEILDSSFAVIHGASAVTASGYDYFGSGGQVSAVPLPGAFWLLGLSFVALGAARRRAI